MASTQVSMIFGTSVGTQQDLGLTALVTAVAFPFRKAAMQLGHSLGNHLGHRERERHNRWLNADKCDFRNERF